MWAYSTVSKFFNWLGKQLGYKEMTDWYNVTKEDIQKHGGAGLLASNYGDSPSKALKGVYPEHNWMLWNFNVIPMRYWGNGENQRTFFQWLGIQLGFEKLSNNAQN